MKQKLDDTVHEFDETCDKRIVAANEDDIYQEHAKYLRLYRGYILKDTP